MLFRNASRQLCLRFLLLLMFRGAEMIEMWAKLLLYDLILRSSQNTCTTALQITDRFTDVGFNLFEWLVIILYHRFTDAGFSLSEWLAIILYHRFTDVDFNCLSVTGNQCVNVWDISLTVNWGSEDMISKWHFIWIKFRSQTQYGGVCRTGN